MGRKDKQRKKLREFAKLKEKQRLLENKIHHATPNGTQKPTSELNTVQQLEPEESTPLLKTSNHETSTPAEKEMPDKRDLKFPAPSFSTQYRNMALNIQDASAAQDPVPLPTEELRQQITSSDTTTIYTDNNTTSSLYARTTDGYGSIHGQSSNTSDIDLHVDTESSAPQADLMTCVKSKLLLTVLSLGLFMIFFEFSAMIELSSFILSGFDRFSQLALSLGSSFALIGLTLSALIEYPKLCTLKSSIIAGNVAFVVGSLLIFNSKLYFSFGLGRCINAIGAALIIYTTFTTNLMAHELCKKYVYYLISMLGAVCGTITSGVFCDLWRKIYIIPTILAIIQIVLLFLYFPLDDITNKDEISISRKNLLDLLPNMFSMLALIATLIYLPVYSTIVWNESYLQLSIRVLPIYLSMFAVVLIQARYAKKYNTSLLGSLVGLIGYYQLYSLDKSTPDWFHFVAGCIPLIGVTSVIMANTKNMRDFAVGILVGGSATIILCQGLFTRTLHDTLRDNLLKLQSEGLKKKELLKILEKTIKNPQWALIDAPAITRGAITNSFALAIHQIFLSLLVISIFIIISSCLVSTHSDDNEAQ
ncbi:hypothetical protein NCAS_0B03780 [Naumovozyma castellii]|uniref:Major facilitator superfamily (MFS) profile domain-containing protein n=1 Tax=Naumovozyma castellii TaxID=27288 RepID=G0VBY5_NAUCA|nr:hypothetical protein NCAS_0B03780 [Naumovozyma castellii CBS 4309]CCC68462.1 hypothetical protein NCAS_0B03780 [Naumovozyma castellii CBS 4309]